jgi:hypothetical protein
MQPSSGYVPFRPFVTPGETDRGWIGFVTLLNTMSIGVGSSEIIQFVVGQSDDVMFSDRRVQGVESTQLVLSLAAAVCGFWL